MPGEGQGRENGLGAGLVLGEGEQIFGGLRSGETADEAMAQPRHPQVGFGISQQGCERDFAPEFCQRDAGLGADAEIALAEL